MLGLRTENEGIFFLFVCVFVCFFFLLCFHLFGCIGNSMFCQLLITYHAGEGHLYFRLDIILVKGLSKPTLNTHFMKIDPKYMFFLFCPSCPFQNLSLWPKTHLFFQFCTPKRCTHVHCLVLKNNSNYVHFLQGWYPTSNTSGPPLPYHAHLISPFQSPSALYAQNQHDKRKCSLSKYTQHWLANEHFLSMNSPCPMFTVNKVSACSSAKGL